MYVRHNPEQCGILRKYKYLFNSPNNYV